MCKKLVFLPVYLEHKLAKHSKRPSEESAMNERMFSVSSCWLDGCRWRQMFELQVYYFFHVRCLQCRFLCTEMQISKYCSTFSVLFQLPLKTFSPTWSDVAVFWWCCFYVNLLSRHCVCVFVSCRGESVWSWPGAWLEQPWGKDAGKKNCSIKTKSCAVTSSHMIVFALHNITKWNREEGFSYPILRLCWRRSLRPFTLLPGRPWLLPVCLPPSLSQGVTLNSVLKTAADKSLNEGRIKTKIVFHLRAQIFQTLVSLRVYTVSELLCVWVEGEEGNSTVTYVPAFC